MTEPMPTTEQGGVDVPREPPAATGAADNGWASTQTGTSLLPAALLGVMILLSWRFIGVRFLDKGEAQSGWLPVVLGGVLPTVFILVYPVWMIRRAGGRVFDRWPSVVGLLIEAGIAFAALISVQILNMLLAVVYTKVSGRPPGVPEQFQEMVGGGGVLTLLVLGVMACVWAPIAEELFFRRFLLRAFAGRFSLAAAIGLQAFIFAILHDYTGMHLAAIFVLGLTMGGLYAWRKTIVTSMILHMMQNTMAMGMLALFMLFSRIGPTMGVYGEPESGGFRITQVEPASAAAKADLRAGDVITEVEGNAVQDGTTLKMLYWGAGIEDGVATLKVQRGDESLDVDVVPQSRSRRKRR